MTEKTFFDSPRTVDTPITRYQAFALVADMGGGIVFSRPTAGLGDAIMAGPAIVATKKLAGGQRPVVVLCSKYVKPIFEMNEYIDLVVSYTDEEVAAGLQEKDLGLLYRQQSTIHRFFNPDPALDYEYANLGGRINKSRQEIFCEVAGVGFDINNYSLSVEGISEVVRKQIFGDRYIVVHRHSADKTRDYPYTQSLVGSLVKYGKRRDFRVVTVGLDGNWHVPGAIDVMRVGVEEVARVIKGASLVIGSDSSAIHMAGALGIPIFGLFGPTDPDVRLKYKDAYWTPPFKRCSRQHCWYIPCKFRFCMKALSPKRVSKLVLRALDGEARRHGVYIAPKKPVQVLVKPQVFVKHPAYSYVRMRGIGDVLMTLPALATLKARKPDLHLVYITSSVCAKLLKTLPIFDEVVVIDYEHGSSGPQPLPVGVDYSSFDKVFNLINAVDFEEGSAIIPRVEMFADCVGVSNIDYRSDWRLRVPREWIDSALDRLKLDGICRGDKVVTMQVTSTGLSRAWLLPRWCELSRLLYRNGYRSVWLSDQRISPYPDCVVNLTGMLSIEEYVGMICASDVFVGPDSSGYHIAGSSGRVPAIALFGSVDPKLRIKHYSNVTPIVGTARCAPCNDWQNHNCIGAKKPLQCMWSIKPRRVFREVERIVNRGGRDAYSILQGF